MGARQKLNEAYFCASSITAIVLGLTFQSWLVFVVVLTAGLAIKAHDGGIRLAAADSIDLLDLLEGGVTLR